MWGFSQHRALASLSFSAVVRYIWGGRSIVCVPIIVVSIVIVSGNDTQRQHFRCLAPKVASVEGRGELVGGGEGAAMFTIFPVYF